MATSLGKKRIVALAGAAGLALALAAGPAEASLLTWDTCKGDSSGLCVGGLLPSPRTSTGSGSSRVYSFGALEDPLQLLGARAYATATDLGEGPVSRTVIDIYTGGLGAGGESSPQHAVDNQGPDELVVFQFPEDGYVPFSLMIGYKKDDADIATFIGGTLGGPDDALSMLASPGFTWEAFVASPGSFGYTAETFLDVPTSSPQYFSHGAAGRYLIVAGRREVDRCGGSRCDGGEDKFKIQQIVAERVPEPSSLLWLGAGLLALGAWRQRR